MQPTGPHHATRARDRQCRSLLLAATAVLGGACQTAPEGRAPLPSRAQDLPAALRTFPGLGVRLLPERFATAVAATPAVHSLSAREVPVREILRSLFTGSDLSLLLHDAVGGQGTFDIRNATAEELFASLLATFDLTYRWDGGIVHVEPTERSVFHLDLPALAQAATVSLGGDDQSGTTASAGGTTGNGDTEAPFWIDLRRDLTALSQNEPDARLVVNARLGTVLAEGRPSFVRRIGDYLDAARGRASRQVSLEVRVLEVQLTEAFRAGVDFALLPGFFHADGQNHAGTLANGAIVGQGLSTGVDALQVGFVNAGQLSLFVDALEQQGQVRVISRPRVSTLNNVPAVIRVVQQVPVIEREIVDSDGVSRTQFNVRFEDAGVAVAVTPQIGDDDAITCVVQPTITEVAGFVSTPDNLIQEPILNTRTVTTAIRIQDGQPVVLGGLRSRRATETLDKVPVLGDLPLLGALFTSTVQDTAETELLLVLLPRILTPAWLLEDVERGHDRVERLRQPFRTTTIRMEEGARAWRESHLDAPSGEPPQDPRTSPTPAPPPDALPSPLTKAALAQLALRRAESAAERGQVEQACREVGLALELREERAEAWLLRAVLEERRDDPRAARQCYARCAALAPASPLPRNNLGLLELRAGNPLAAEGHFLAALELADLPAVRSNLAIAYLAQDRLADAERELRAALAAAGTALPEASVNLGVCLERCGRADAATEAYRAYLLAGGDPRDPRLRPLHDHWRALGILE